VSTDWSVFGMRCSSEALVAGGAERNWFPLSKKGKPLSAELALDVTVTELANCNTAASSQSSDSSDSAGSVHQHLHDRPVSVSNSASALAEPSITVHPPSSPPSKQSVIQRLGLPAKLQAVRDLKDNIVRSASESLLSPSASQHNIVLMPAIAATPTVDIRDGAPEITGLSPNSGPDVIYY